MTEAELHRRTHHKARRILRGLVQGKTERIFPGYHSFERGEARAWWRSELAAPEWGPVIGVFDRSAGCEERVVVAQNGLAVLANETLPIWVPYAEVGRFAVLSKEPPAPSLPVWLRDGRLIQLPFTGGAAFTIMGFLGYVAGNWAQVALDRLEGRR